jgi:hypothetical protein
MLELVVLGGPEMAKVLGLVLIVFLFLQTPFYKEQVVPQYKKLEATIAVLLTIKPEDLKPKRYPAMDPSRTPTQLPPKVTAPVDSSFSSFMPKKSPKVSGTKKSDNVLNTKK